MLLISVHFPKAGGTSLRESFRAVFKPEEVIFNPPDDDPGNPVSRFSLDPTYFRREGLSVAPSVKLIHGHFSPRRFEDLSDVRFITFLRNPVENIISLHCFYRLSEDFGNPLRTYVRKHNLPVAALATMPKVRYLMSREFFGLFDMKKFSFIGDTSTYEKDIQSLSALIGKPLRMHFLNANRENSVLLSSEENFYTMMEDRKLVAHLEDLLSDEMAFYEKVQAMRANLAWI